MSRVEFKEPRIRARRSAQPKPRSILQRLVIKSGMAKNATQASCALFIIALLAFAASGWILYRTFSTSGETVYREDIPEEIWRQIPEEQRDKIPSRK